MEENRYKRRVNISLDPHIHDYIKRECKKNGINFSQWVTMKVYEQRKEDAKIAEKVYHEA